MSEWPDLAVLELLVAVAERGSISQAARAVGLTQPAATRALARLERRTGAPLLRRSTSGATPTTEGALLVDWSRELLASARQLRDAQATLAAGPSGLEVAASMTIAEHLLPRWLAPLRASRPDCSVALEVTNSAEVTRLVREGEVALGFVEDGRVPSGVSSVTVGTDELVVVTAPGHPWARREDPVGPGDLAATALIVREEGSGTRVALDDALAAHGLIPAAPALALTSTSAVRVSAAAGIAPAVLSELAAAQAVAAGDLVVVPTHGLDLRRSLRALWSGQSRPTGPAATLLEVAVRGR